MNTDICKLLYPSRIYCFSELRMYAQKKYLLLLYDSTKDKSPPVTK